MPIVRPSVLVVLGLAATVGCGPPPMLPVTGTVKLDGKPVSSCKVGLFPDVSRFDPGRHGFGFGITGPDGRYAIQHPQGETGIWPGPYRVTFVAWVDRGGKPVSADAKPSEVEGGVRNLFPQEYEGTDTTPERITVKGGGEPNVFDFEIRSSR